MLAGATTKESYQDFQLHLEFCVHSNPRTQGGREGDGNSGIYLQRRYEVQIMNSYGKEAGWSDCGALYKLRKPDVNASRPKGTWQTYDITFRAARFDKKGNKTENARITLMHNGVVIHNDVEIECKTCSGKPEGAKPGQIQIQNHSNPTLFRNIWIVPHL
jgi:hypothetical protein